MFCTKCGRPIPDGQKDCYFCNPTAQEPSIKMPNFSRAPMDLDDSVKTAPSQEPLYQPPVQKSLYQTPAQTAPVQQPVPQVPVQEVPVQQSAPQVPVQEVPVQQSAPQVPVQQVPVQQSAPQQATYQVPVQQSAPTVAPQPAFTLNTPAESSKPKKAKGGKGGKIVLAIIALLLVAGIVLAAVNWNSIVRFWNRNFGKPEAYLQDVEKENVSQAADHAADVYDSAMDIFKNANPATNASITLKLGDTAVDILGSLLTQADVDVDLEWVENITLTPTIDIYEDTMRMDVGVGINGVSLTTASAIWDLENQTIYLGIPELHDAYIELDATEVFGSEAASVAEALAMSREIMQALADSMPSGEQIKELLNNYMGIVIEGITEAEKENKTIKLGSVKQELLVVTAELSQKDILKVVSSVLEAAEKDETIEDILNNFDDSIAETTGGETVGLYEAFSDAVDEALDSMDDLIDDAENDEFLTMETFFDSKDAIVGRAFTIEAEGEELYMRSILVTEGNKWAFEYDMPTMYASGKGTVKDSKYSGKLTVSMEEKDIYSIELKDCIATEEQNSGTWRLSLESDMLDMMELDSSISTMVEQASLVLTVDGEAVTIGVDFAGNQLLAFSLSGEITEAGKITLPESVSAEDDEAGAEWLSALDFEAILNNLEKAGVPSEYVDMAEQAVESFREEFN